MENCLYFALIGFHNRDLISDVVLSLYCCVSQAAPEGSELPLPVAPPNPDGDDNDDQGAASGSPLSKLDEQEGNGSPSQLPSSSASARSTGGGSQAAATADGAAAGAVDTAVASNSSAQVPYNFKGGIKGTLGLRDIFGLLGHGLGLLPSEQAYIVDELVLAQANEKGHSLKEASTLASKVQSANITLDDCCLGCFAPFSTLLLDLTARNCLAAPSLFVTCHLCVKETYLSGKRLTLVLSWCFLAHYL